MEREHTTDTPRGPSRREVLAGAVAAAAGLGCPNPLHADEEPAQRLPRRALGRTGFHSTIFGLGCFPLGNLSDEEASVRVIVSALDAGCNYFDTAPSYANGRSETRIAKALAMRPKAKVFLASKTHTRSADDARRDLEGSLARLGVERLDLVQMHAVTDADDLERALAKDGPLAALTQAREEGLIRFIGVTGHADPVIVRKAFERWAFDTVLLPLNCVDLHHLSFEKETLPAAVRKGLGRIGMKAFASGNLVQKGVDANACLRYAYGLDVSTVVVGCRTVDEVGTAVRVARENRPFSPEEREALLKVTKPHHGKDVEWYKRA